MNNIIVLYENYTIYTDDNMGYIFELKECKNQWRDRLTKR